MTQATRRIYRRTSAGEQAFTTQDRAIPLDYQRVLGALAEPSDFKVLCSLLPQYDEAAIAEWLTELEEAGLLEHEGAAGAQGGFEAHFSAGRGSAVTLVDEDARGLDAAAAGVGQALAASGAYIVASRRTSRPQGKQPGDTTILLVEDDPDQVALADLRLSMAGYRVNIAGSVQGMVEALDAHGVPDLVLLDVMLPDGNGFEVLRRMRRHSALTSVPVVLLTAKADLHDVREGLQAGADAYITKPYSKRVLAETIARLLG
jgi:CheY-like chemotaxis protein